MIPTLTSQMHERAVQFLDVAAQLLTGLAAAGRRLVHGRQRRTKLTQHLEKERSM